MSEGARLAVKVVNALFRGDLHDIARRGELPDRLTQELLFEPCDSMLHLFNEIRKYLVAEGRLLNDAQALFEFINAGAKCLPLSKIGEAAIPSHLCVVFAREGEKVPAGVKEVIQSRKLYPRFEADYRALGVNEETDPLNVLGLTLAAERDIASLPFRFDITMSPPVFPPNGPIAREARYTITVTDKGSNAPMTALAVPAGDDYRYPQICSFPSRDKPVLRGFAIGQSLYLMATNGDGLVTVWRNQVGTPSWEMLATTAPSLPRETRRESFTSFVKNEELGPRFFHLGETKLATDGEGRVHLVAKSVRGESRPSLWKVYRV